MKVLNDSSAVMAFCQHVQKTKPENVRGEHIRRHNREMIKAALGWPFKLETRRFDVFAMAHDHTLSTLLESLVMAIRALVPESVSALHSFRDTCFLSRSVAREVTRVLANEMIRLVVRECPACCGDICMRNRVAICETCGRVDADGPLPGLNDDDGTGVSAAIETMLVDAISDDTIILMYMCPGTVKTGTFYVIDTMSFDDPEMSAGLLPCEIELQVFVRQPAGAADSDW